MTLFRFLTLLVAVGCTSALIMGGGAPQSSVPGTPPGTGTKTGTPQVWTTPWIRADLPVHPVLGNQSSFSVYLPKFDESLGDLKRVDLVSYARSLYSIQNYGESPGPFSNTGWLAITGLHGAAMNGNMGIIGTALGQPGGSATYSPGMGPPCIGSYSANNLDLFQSSLSIDLNNYQFFAGDPMEFVHFAGGLTMNVFAWNEFYLTSFPPSFDCTMAELTDWHHAWLQMRYVYVPY